MLAHAPFPATLSPVGRAAIVVDLIGDVDATAARSYAATADHIVARPGERVLLNLRHAAVLHAGGITVLARTISQLRARGMTIDVVAEGKRVRTALRAAQIASRPAGALDCCARERHVMIVRNGDPSRDSA